MGFSEENFCFPLGVNTFRDGHRARSTKGAQLPSDLMNVIMHSKERCNRDKRKKVRKER